MKYAGLLCIALLAASCAPTERQRTVATESVVAAKTPYQGQRIRMVIGQVENQSPYMRGIFSDGTDRLGLQAQQILKTHLSQSGRFLVLDRVNMGELSREAQISGNAQKLTGGQMLLTGAVTEFGRKDVGALGSVFGGTRKQVAYAKVQVSIVDVATSQVLYSEQGAGEFELESGQILGFGSAAGYDATLNDKVLNKAMVDLVNKLVVALDSKQFRPVE